MHLEDIGGVADFKLQGDPAEVALMIASAMKVNQEIAAAFIAPVIKYAKEQGIDCGDFGKMVIIPGMEL